MVSVPVGGDGPVGQTGAAGVSIDLSTKALCGRRVAVIGMGMSNMAVIAYLIRAGAVVTAADRKPAEAMASQIAAIGTAPVRFAFGDGYLAALAGQDIAVLTPGMRRDLPELAAAKASGTVMTSEIGLLMAACPASVIGITGSAGKTTTTTLVGLMLQAARSGVWVGGNIGRPLIAEVDGIGPEDLVVLELSSFQLQDLEISPQIAAVLNVNPNHLDIHASMDEYVDAKRNIYRYQPAEGSCVFGADSAIASALAQEYRGRSERWPAARPPIMFSRREELDAGASLAGDQLWLRLASLGTGLPDGLICRRGDLKLPGDHNVGNVLAAAAVAGLAGAGLPMISDVATTFRGVEHRLEFVGQVDGVDYYNDSIATAPDRTIAALRTLRGPLVLILGGYDKRIAFDSLGDEICASEGIAHVVLQGATAESIEQAILAAAGRRAQLAGAASCLPGMTRIGGDFAEAVSHAARLARAGDTVLLSPACASFDQFSNFEERGRAFKRLVMALPRKGGNRAGRA